MEVMRLIFLILSCLFYKVTWSQSINVTTNQGLVEGFAINNGEYYEFVGIPYAAPPLGDLRFEPPKEPAQWGAISSRSYKAACMQDGAVLGGLLQAATVDNTRTSDDAARRLTSITTSEDCLYLNIYTPYDFTNPGELLPVMIFIHGGDYVSGTGSIYKGGILASQYGVILVNFNYRLGAFGFLSQGNEDSEDNLGLLDQKMAIEWIKENIQEFGGDPKMMTIFGEGAGASSVHLHMMIMRETAIFKNAIIQSARYDDGVWSKIQCKDRYNEFLKNLSMNEDDTLKTIAASNIMQVAIDMGEWRPCMNDYPSQVIQQDNFTSEVNVMVGTNSAAGHDDPFLLNDNAWLNTMTDEVIKSTFSQLYGNVTSDLITRMSKNYFHFYSTYGSEETAFENQERQTFYSTVYSDQVYKTWAQEVAMMAKESCRNCSVFKYLFTEPSSTTPRFWQLEGAKLTEELPFIFGYLENDATTLTSDMMTYWTNFAKSSDPNSQSLLNDLVTWSPYLARNESNETCRLMFSVNSDDTLKATSQDEVTSRSLEFWNGYYDLLGFSCLVARTDTVIDVIEEENEELYCEETVSELFGISLSNELAAILMFVFASLTGLFLITTFAACFCYNKTNKKLKKEKKKNKKDNGHDNPHGVEYKL